MPYRKLPKNLTFKNALVLSLFLHVVIKVALFGMGFGFGGGGEGDGTKGDKKGGNSETEGKEHGSTTNGSDDRIIEKQVEVMEVPPEVLNKMRQIEDDLKKREEQAKRQKMLDECKYWFGGIGVSMNGGRIIEIYAGYPAQKAGLKVGDDILNPNDIRGEVGTVSIVMISRNGEVMQFNIVREKICIDKQD